MTIAGLDICGQFFCGLLGHFAGQALAKSRARETYRQKNKRSTLFEAEFILVWVANRALLRLLSTILLVYTRVTMIYNIKSV